MNYFEEKAVGAIRDLAEKAKTLETRCLARGEQIERLKKELKALRVSHEERAELNLMLQRRLAEAGDRGESSPATVPVAAAPARHEKAGRIKGFVYLVMARRPGPESQFIELEDHEGNSCDAGMWRKEGSCWTLSIKAEAPFGEFAALCQEHGYPRKISNREQFRAAMGVIGTLSNGGLPSEATRDYVDTLAVLTHASLGQLDGPAGGPCDRCGWERAEHTGTDMLCVGQAGRFTMSGLEATQ